MAICWAKSLGDCGGGWSKEHIISQSLFDSDHVTISGVDWTGQNVKKIPISGASAKLLCRKHNSKLSPLDSSIKKIKIAFDKYHADATIYLTGTPMKAEYNIDGKEFERWILKTSINHLFYSPTLYSGYSLTHHLVEIVFGMTEFEYSKKCGLYMVDPIIHQEFVNNPANVSIYPVLYPINGEKYLLGTLIDIFGHSFFLKTAETENVSLQFRGTNLINERAFHPKKMGIVKDGKCDDSVNIQFVFL